MSNNLEKLKAIYELCEAEVTISYNEHKSFYETVGQFLSNRKDLIAGIDVEVLKKMIDLDQMVCIQAYQRTPIAFYLVYHWDVEAAIDEMFAILESESAK